MTNRQNSVNADGIFEPFRLEEVPREEFAHGKFASSFRQLSTFGGGSHVGVVMEELAPGKQSNMRHYHMLEEEHVLVLEGNLTLLLGADRYEMSAGSYVCFPAGQKAGHALLNNGTAICRYLLIGERNPHDVIVYPDTGRVGVRLTGEGYSKAATMEYWDGEDAT
jgi:uncharacterized cupin superfamily protein